jgi:phosphatidylinositol phospholipase C delta
MLKAYIHICVCIHASIFIYAHPFIQSDGASDVSDNDDDETNGSEVAPEYKEIITIKAGKPRGKSLKDALALEPYVKRVSLSEPQLSKVAQEHPDAVVRYA